MKKVVILTSRLSPQGTPGDLILRAAFEALGVQVIIHPWDELPELNPQTHVLFCRTTWDYHQRLDEFLPFFVWAESHGFKFINPLDTLKWNISKSYLQHLESLGIPTVPTAYVEGFSESVIDILEQRNWPKAVLKPAVSASAHRTFTLTRGVLPLNLIEAMKSPDFGDGLWLVQPFLESISKDGEVSLIFVNDEGRPHFSHAILKKPSQGDFRVQREFGGTASVFSPSPELLKFGLDVMGKLPMPWVYARLDILDYLSNKPLVGEIELIEPELFFELVPQVAGLLAKTVAGLLR